MTSDEGQISPSMEIARPFREAIANIPGKNDWMLAPLEHGVHLSSSAGPLKRVLQQDDIARLQNVFTQADAAAADAQQRYKKLGKRGLYAATLSTVAGASFVLPIDSFYTSPFGMLVSVVQFISLAVALIATRTLAKEKPFERWMEQRAHAEAARVGLFGALIKRSVQAQSGELNYLPLSFGYFERFHLEVQMRYYRDRGHQHRRARFVNNRWLTTSIVLTALSLFFAASGGLHLMSHVPVALPAWLSDWAHIMGGLPGHRLSLTLAIVASSLYALGSARSLLDLDERNASRYLITADNLDYLVETELPSAWSAAIRGADAEVQKFVDLVQSQILGEHREWVLLRKQIRS